MNHSDMGHHHDHAMHATTEMNHSAMGHDMSVVGDDGIDHSSMDHSGMDHSGMDHSGMDHSNLGMQMTFYFGTDVVILFDWWKVTTVGGMIGSIIGIIIFSILYEGLKYAREHLSRQAVRNMNLCAGADRNNFTNNSSPIQYMEQIMIPPRTSMLSSPHLLQTVLHMLQLTMSYMLMLVFMTYNVWLCLACVVGGALGYFLFGWKRLVVVDINEHCH